MLNHLYAKESAMRKEALESDCFKTVTSSCSKFSNRAPAGSGLAGKHA